MRGSQSARVLARLLVACAVIVGVFAMHGLPEQTCAGGSDMGHSASQSGMSMGGSVQDVVVGGPSVRSVGVEQGVDGMTHGGVCVATFPLRGLAEVLALLLAAAFAMGVFAAAPDLGRYRGQPSHRAPPVPGARLLTTLCVSRT